jgi:Protein of unknown function (DUF2778)
MWTFVQRSGKLYDPSGKYIATGYAGGACGAHPEGVNNPDMADQHNIGPLPQGTYTFGEPIGKHPKLGLFVIPLIPDPSNNMFGRSGFFLHGDLVKGPAESASDGCIIMGPAYRHACAESPDQQIQVVSDWTQ